jgi:hypothetical protein
MDDMEVGSKRQKLRNQTNMVRSKKEAARFVLRSVTARALAKIRRYGVELLNATGKGRELQ